MNNNKPVIAVAVAVLIAVVGIWYVLHSRSQHLPTVTPPAAETPASAADAGISHPLPAQAGNNEGPLPALADSDAPLADALDNVSGSEQARSLLRPENLIRHLVVTIDNLPRQKVALEQRPVNSVPGAFVVTGDEEHAQIDPRNYARYTPYVDVVRAMDMQQLVTVYQHFYPLFQQSYQNLGYPSGYFNDRLVQTIDVLLATPDAKGPIDLTRPNVMYLFADPALESRPAGQKLLLRMGPANESIIKQKLSELRSAIIESGASSTKKP